MTSLEKLNENQLKERNAFEKTKKAQLDYLTNKQEREIAQKGSSQSLEKKHEEELSAFLQTKSKEGQALYERHERQYQAERDFMEPKKNYESEMVQLEGAALSVERREEAENTKNNWEATKQEERKKLLDQLKERWAKGKDREIER